MKRIIFISFTIFNIMIVNGQQTEPLSAAEHNFIMRKILDNKKSLLSDKDLLKSKNQAGLLLFFSTKNYIPPSIKVKILAIKTNVQKQKTETISKSDLETLRTLFQSLEESKSPEEKLKIIEYYKNKFLNRKINTALIFSKNILTSGIKDIYNAEYYEQINLFPGASQSFLKSVANTISGDDVKGAISGAIGGIMLGGPGGAVACGVAGGVSNSVASAIWEFAEWASPEESSLLPAMQEFQQILVNSVEQVEQCTNSNTGTKNLGGINTIKDFYTKKPKNENEISILARRQYLGSQDKLCLPLIPNCNCVTEPCNCPEICVPRKDILSINRTFIKDKKGNYLIEYIVRKGSKINVDKSGNTTIEEFYNENLSK